MKYILTTLISGLLTVCAVQADTARTESHAEVFLRHHVSRGVLKSGTPSLMRLLAGDSEESSNFREAYSQAMRPVMDTYTDSETGRFRVHYDLSGNDAPDLTDLDLNGVPDYVDSTMAYLEYAWQVIVVNLGYGRPMPDGTLGGSRDVIDCYLKDLSPQSLYGVTNPDVGNSGSITSYMTVDNNFTERIYPTKGYDALKITTAHEFFHIVHYSYYGGYDSVWWMEHTAVWLEDYAWDNVDDYLNYAGFLFTDRNLPLDTWNGSFEYGASLFAFHIAQKYGHDMLRSIWSTFRDKQNGKIENMNELLPDGVIQAVSDLAVWLYFTGARANYEDFFEEAGLIVNTMKPEQRKTSKTVVDSMTFRHYTFKYVDISPPEGLAYGDSLYFDFKDRSNGLWKNRVILYRSPTNYQIMDINGDTPVIGIPRPFDKAVLVITNASQSDKSYTYLYNIDIVSSKGVKEKPIPIPFALHQNFPNPFNATTTIPFTIQEQSHVTLKIMNIQGASVATLVDGIMYPGSYTETFDAAGLSSGQYFAVLESNQSRAIQKMSFLK